MLRLNLPRRLSGIALSALPPHCPAPSPTSGCGFIALKHCRPGWHAAVARILRRDVLPYLGETLADRITWQDIAGLVSRVEERGHTSKANHTLVVCRNVLRWSIDTGRVDLAQAARCRRSVSPR